MTKIYRTINCLLREYIRFFFSKRTFSFFLILLFFVNSYIRPIMKFSKAMNVPITPWVAPFLFSSIYFDLFFLIGAIYLYSKVPFLERWQMYPFIRLGKWKWLFVQIGNIIMSAFSYTILTIIITALPSIKNILIKNEWGEIFYTLALTDAGSQYNIVFPISYKLINSGTPCAVLGISILIIGLIVTVLGLLMFMFSVYCDRIIAIIVAMIFSIMPILIENLGLEMQKIFVRIMPAEWIKIAKIGGSFRGIESLGVSEIIIRLSIIIVVICLLIVIRFKNIELEWYGED